MKTKLTKVIAMMFVVLMVVTAMPVYAGSADSMNCDEAKASKVLPKEDTKFYWVGSSYAEPPMGTVLGTWSPRSDYVRWLQECLNALGYNCGSVDGWYGNNTKNAVKSFQRTNGLEADGVFGDCTHKAINKCLFDGYYYSIRYKVSAKNGLNVREYRSVNSSIIGTLRYGDYVDVWGIGFSEDNTLWGWIFYFDGYEEQIGWICLDYCTYIG